MLTLRVKFCWTNICPDFGQLCSCSARIGDYPGGKIPAGGPCLVTAAVTDPSIMSKLHLGSPLERIINEHGGVLWLSARSRRRSQT